MKPQNTTPTPTHDTSAWRFQIFLAFGIALGLTSIGIFYLPVDMWTKGYLTMGVYFTVSSAFGLAKTMRDAHESDKFATRLSEAKAEKMIREYTEA